MRKNLMNKFTLRILSLFIAIFIWLLVVNIEDPVRTITITVYRLHLQTNLILKV